jgi:hypothetical protein
MWLHFFGPSCAPIVFTIHSTFAGQFAVRTMISKCVGPGVTQHKSVWYSSTFLFFWTSEKRHSYDSRFMSMIFGFPGHFQTSHTVVSW